MDELDTKIVQFLQNDGRMAFLKIAKELGVSEGTIRKRVAKMQDQEVIKKFTVTLRNRIGAIVGIETNPHIETKKIVELLQSIGLREIYEVTGRFDIVCVLDSVDTEAMNEQLEKIRISEGVNHTETFTILKEN
jgi:Lrp/AsnC family transcriptional regulator of lysine biosynthesis